MKTQLIKKGFRFHETDKQVYFESLDKGAIEIHFMNEYTSDIDMIEANGQFLITPPNGWQLKDILMLDEIYNRSNKDIEIDVTEYLEHLKYKFIQQFCVNLLGEEKGNEVIAWFDDIGHTNMTTPFQAGELEETKSGEFKIPNNDFLIEIDKVLTT